MWSVVFAVAHEVPAEGIEQVEMAQRIDAVLLDDPAALTLEYVIQQTAYALGMKSHPGFPIRPPAIKRDIERAQHAVLIVENHEFGMHVGIHLDEVMLGRAENPDQFNSRPLQSRVVLAVGKRHLAPVHNALHQDSLLAGMDQMGDEVVIINAVNAHLDGA